jgi:hypothetical protein
LGFTFGRIEKREDQLEVKWILIKSVSFRRKKKDPAVPMNLK